MSRTIQKTKDNKPWESVSGDNIKRGNESHRTYLIKKRLMDESNKLWGFLIESNGVQKRVTSDILHSMITVYNIPVAVDWTGNDRPATVSVVHERTENGMRWYFRTIGDRYSKNNLANVPTLKAQSSHLRKHGRLELEDVRY